MVGVCKAIHEHTRYVVRVGGGVSGEFGADRGVREGCPSSPALFNLYWAVVMEQFRARREERAREMGRTPGVRWRVEVKGRVVHEWEQSAQGGGGARQGGKDRMEGVWGDAGFADDTLIMGSDEGELGEAAGM